MIKAHQNNANALTDTFALFFREQSIHLAKLRQQQV
jgi:hypothetical protein